MQRQSSSNSSFGGNSSAAASTRRRQADFIKLATSGKYQVTATENIGDFYVLFHGPKETPYEGGHWQIHVLLTEQYPYKSPSIGFANSIFHPNVEERSGSVCLDVINQTWTPMYDLINVFDVFLPQLLRYPNSSDPMNPAAAALQLESVSKYTSYVQEHIQRYATAEKAAAVVAHLNGDEEATPAKQPAGETDVSPATTFASRGLTDSPPSALGEDDIGRTADLDDDEPEEIDL